MLDPVLLQTFLIIAEGNSFSEASRRLNLRQSTVSEHVQKLEKCVGHRLFIRDTHSVAMTSEGEALVEFARNIMETNARAADYFAGTEQRGRLRFGASEDLVPAWLPEVLEGFVAQHPLVEFEFTVALSAVLMNRLDSGELDIVLCKRWAGDERGDLVWRDRLVWVAAKKDWPRPEGPVPLVLYRPPAITRSAALAALEHAGVPWRIACTSSSLNGLTTAARAGLGLMAHSRRLIPEGLAELEPRQGLPDLGPVEFVLMKARRSPGRAVAALSAAIRARANLETA
jgi:DNA-binding transcriptional LysR family regulator